MATTEKFCLKWNDFEANIGVAFRELRDDKDFFDMTIACEDNQMEAHKMILAACSPFFRDILRKNPHSHPLLFIKGVRICDLKAILDFMYHGEVQVAQEDLNSFLSVAEELKVKGLTQNKSTPKEKTTDNSFKSQGLPGSPSFQSSMKVAPLKRDEGPTSAHRLPGPSLNRGEGPPLANHLPGQPLDAQSSPIKTELTEDHGIHNSDSSLLLYQDFGEEANGDDPSHNYSDFRGENSHIYDQL